MGAGLQRTHDSRVFILDNKKKSCRGRSLAVGYSMKTEPRDMTELVCDMRGFTRPFGSMQPADLQALLDRVFDRLTQVIGANQGTVVEHMRDCVQGRASNYTVAYQPRHPGSD